MRAIDADALVAKMDLAIAMLKSVMKDFDFEDDPECQMELKAYQDIRNGIKDEPTIEPERKTGEWMPKHSDYCKTWECSYCGYRIDLEDGGIYHFCSACGTKMIKAEGSEE